MKSETQPQTTGTIRSKLNAAWKQIRYLPRVWNIVWDAARIWTILSLVVLAILGLLPVLTVSLTRDVVDGVAGIIGKGASWDVVAPVLWPAGLMAGALLLIELLSGVLRWFRDHQTALVQDHMVERIHETSVAVDLAFYESPEYFDHLHRARNEAFYRPQKLVENAGSLMRSLITLLAMSALLIRFSPWIPVVLIFSTVPALVVVLRHAIRQHRWRLENTADERRAWYCAHVLTGNENAAEVRLFDVGGVFKERYVHLRKRLREDWLRISRSRVFAEFGATLVALLAMGGCVGWMGFRALKGQLTLGELALFYAAFRQGQQMMRSLLENMGDIYRNVLFLGDLFAFLDLKATIASPEDPAATPEHLVRSIEFEKVSFSYPGSERRVLDGFSLHIPANKVVAVVGANGSGKSTLLRLMCRLYDPDGGRVLFDGCDIKTLRVDELQRSMTVLFQEPVHYSETVGENIRLGDLGSNPSVNAIEGAARAAHVTPIIDKLPRGYETLLGKWFKGGTELSAGEWQRIALARAFLRKGPIVLLDEPTSAMDSWAEAEWMDRLRALVEGRTALIVTHRFTTAMKADVIYVMKNGEIVESGSHRELVSMDGLYAASWKVQMGGSER